MSDYFTITDEAGTMFHYEAAGPQDAAEQHYATDDGDGEQPFIVAIVREDAGVLLTRAQIDAWAGTTVTDDELVELGDAIPNSSIPDAIETIVNEAIRA